MPDEFQLVAGHVALDFANTLDFRFDRKRLINLLPTYERLLEFARQSGVISGQQARSLLSRTTRREASLTLKRAIELRETLDSLFRAVAMHRQPSKQRLRTFNRFLAEGHVPDTIVWQKADFVRTSRDLTATSDAPLWPIIDASAALLASHDRASIRECSEPSCRWLFLDHSKNHSRRWCSMNICGNRSKVKRFRYRLRAGS
jgi:predicted RNA-binding Zn ribbon-like protein